MNPDSTRQPFRLPLSVNGLLEVCCVLLCVATVATFLGRFWWMLELSVHFRAQYALALCALTESGVPFVEATLEVGGTPIRFLGVHTLPPSTAENARLRKRQLQELAARARGKSQPVVVCGDLNATPWSPWFADLLRDGGLRNSAQGRGLFGSWPALLPAPLRIPLDHCLVSPSIAVIDRRMGPRIGGDHLPVLVELSVPD